MILLKHCQKYISNLNEKERLKLKCVLKCSLSVGTWLFTKHQWQKTSDVQSYIKFIQNVKKYCICKPNVPKPFELKLLILVAFFTGMLSFWRIVIRKCHVVELNLLGKSKFCGKMHKLQEFFCGKSPVDKGLCCRR